MGNALVPIAFPDASIAIAVAPLRELNVSRTNSSDFRFDPRTGRAVLALAAEQIRQQESMMRHVAPHRDGRDTLEKSCGQALGEAWPHAIRSGTGRGGDVTGSRNSNF